MSQFTIVQNCNVKELNYEHKTDNLKYYIAKQDRRMKRTMN